MFTRQDYLNNKCTHRQYYAQFVTPELTRTLLQIFPITKLLNCKDEHLNDIPIKEWDRATIILNIKRDMYTKTGDFPTLAGNVCILKESAQQAIDNFNKNCPYFTEEKI